MPTASQVELDEPDRRIDALIDYFADDGDDALRAWAVEALAGGLGVDAVVVEGESAARRLRALGDALGGRLALAIYQTPEQGPRLVEAVLEGLLVGLRDGPPEPVSEVVRRGL
ncbi:MAG: hypothetical protein KC549_06845 [Myxococcales bacterium]|nr:hypothetical protein [Myxococcales bacterium]MCB9544685.1 hypothetical protein [Myxococcales bacterium]